MGVRNSLQAKAKALAPGFHSLWSSVLVEDSLILKTEAITAAGAASTTIPIALVTADAGDMAVTLADGSNTGQVKIFHTVADANSWKITPDTTDGAYTKVTCTLIGDTVMFLWTGTGWSILSRASGAAAGATAVVGMPIVA